MSRQVSSSESIFIFELVDSCVQHVMEREREGRNSATRPPAVRLSLLLLRHGINIGAFCPTCCTHMFNPLSCRFPCAGYLRPHVVLNLEMFHGVAPA